MISKILIVIIKLIVFIITAMITLITRLLPNFPIEQMQPGINGFFNLFTNAVNMTNFLVGSGYVLYLDIIIAIWTTKHTILPIVLFIRRMTTKNVT